jgi:hypothetical protein
MTVPPSPRPVLKADRNTFLHKCIVHGTAGARQPSFIAYDQLRNASAAKKKAMGGWAQ